jgi:hypothetical protein
MVSNQPRSYNLQLDYIERVLADLEKKHETISEQLRAADATEVDRLKISLSATIKQMRRLEQEKRAIEEEQTQISFQEALDSMTSLLQLYENQVNDMKAAQSKVCRKHGFRILRQPCTSAEVISQLLEIPWSQNSLEVLEEFAAYLLVFTQESRLKVALQSWGSQHASEHWADLLQQANQHQIELTQQSHPALLVLIRQNDEASTQSQAEMFDVKAWLIRDIHHYRECKKDRDKDAKNDVLGIISSTVEKTFSEPELLIKLPEYISEVLSDNSYFFTVEPELHIFLPFELMNHDIDRWNLVDDCGESLFLGHEYKVIFRCARRLSPNRHTSRWKNRWKEHQAQLERYADQSFTCGDDSDLKALLENLKKTADTVVGLKVVTAPQHTGAQSLFGVLLQVGIPVAIWSRKNLEHSTNEAELNRILSTCFLKNLPDTVHDERNGASHISQHLSLLWDDPLLVPP